MKIKSVLLLSILTVLLSGCSKHMTVEDIDVSVNNSVNEITESSAETTESIESSAETAEITEQNSLQNVLKAYIECARSYKKQLFSEHETECMISLQNLFGDENPEMILSVKGDSYNSEYYFATNESGEPVCMGAYEPSTELDGLYIDLTNNTCYIICRGSHSTKENLNWISIKKLELPLKSKVSPDFAEYKNSDALSFMENTNLYFIKYDEEDRDNLEAGAAMFYCEDSGLYEAYSVSKQILDLTSVEINDYVNREGNHIYSYLPGENYLVSRQEYEQIKSKTFEILTEVSYEPEISSGWINIDYIDKWIESFASNETGENDLLMRIERKAAELNGETLGIINNDFGAAIAVIVHDSAVYDYWFFDGGEESLILTSTVYNGSFTQKNFDGESFLIVYEQVIGHAYPSDIVALTDKPIILSAIEHESTEYSGLFYSPHGEIVCMRGDGVSIGAHNVIPYYWNKEAEEFLPCAIKEITVEELKAVDFQNVVENIDNIISIYRRDNGLVHINYFASEDLTPNALETVSKTYVQTETGLREYDFEIDDAYGFFMECLLVTE